MACVIKGINWNVVPSPKLCLQSRKSIKEQAIPFEDSENRQTKEANWPHLEKSCMRNTIFDFTWGSIQIRQAHRTLEIDILFN